MYIDKQSRWSKVVWTAMAALVLFILKNYGLLGPTGLPKEALDN